jgi:pimeloyl-ACP methyl ester carboxylesterase
MAKQAQPDELSKPDLITRQGSTGLVVLVHGFGGSPEAMSDVVAVILRARLDCDVFIYRHYHSFLSFDDPIDVVLDLKAKVDRLLSDRGYREVVLVGYSMGALLVRKLYVCACGENSDAPFEPQLTGACSTAAPWASRVTRIVLLAGINRGWTIDHHASIPRAVLSWAGVLIGNTIWAVRYLLSKVTARISPRPPLVFTIRHGATFITQLRIQWLSMQRHAGKKQGVGKALTAQLLGTVDDLVSPEDNIDLVTGADFVYLEIPYSGHFNVVQMRGQPGGRARAAVLHNALSFNDTQLRSLSVPLTDITPASPDSTVGRVVFVIHGIRDLGYWTRKIAGRVKTRARLGFNLRWMSSVKDVNEMPAEAKALVIVADLENRLHFRIFDHSGSMVVDTDETRLSGRAGQVEELTKQLAGLLPHALTVDDQDRLVSAVTSIVGYNQVASITSSYGYFPMLPFLLPTRRRAKVEWLMDEYTEALARYPKANFYYVGHSNGTYLLARALEDYSSVHFDRVVFAGSVVRRRYDWARFMRPNRNTQVNSVLNYVATRDWVVAIFPKAIQTLKLQDLGSAGHDGFGGPGAGTFVHQIEYVQGSHGAALAEDYWDEIADFINDGTVPQQQVVPGYQSSRNPLIVLLGWFAPLVWVLIGLTVFAFGRCIYYWIQGDVPRTFALLAYAWLCWKILTRV